MVCRIVVVACLAGCDLVFPIEAGPGGDGGRPGPGGNGLLARYDMELDGNTVPDLSGHGLDAQCLADDCPRDVSLGDGGRGVEFDGLTQILTVPDVGALVTPKFTVVVTLTPSDGSGDNVFRCVVGIPYAGGSLNTWQLCVRSDGALQFETVHDNEQEHQSFSPAGAVPNETTHQVAIGWDGATKRIFVDGNLVQSEDVSGQILFDPATGLHIGADIDSGAEFAYYAGIVDDVQVYDRPLRADELFELVP